MTGLEGLSFGQIASDLQLSKSGLAGYFDSKMQWQLAVIAQARSVFHQTVIRADQDPAGPDTPQTVIMCRAWLAYLEEPVFPGGCFFFAVASEFDDRDGPVRDAIRRAFADLRTFLEQRISAEAELLEGVSNSEQAAFDVIATLTHLNQCLRLGIDPEAGRRARESLTNILGYAV